LFIVFILSLSLCFAVKVVSPVNTKVSNGDMIDLGIIGPGQTVSILIDPLVSTGGIHDIGGVYDLAEAKDLPSGWKSEESKLYQNPLQVTVTADPNAVVGVYYSNIIVMDERDGEELGNVTFVVKVTITWDVMDVEVSPAKTTVGPGQPARFSITIYNKASTSDVFEVSAVGPRKWEFKRPVFVAAKSSRTIDYELVGGEEEEYTATIKVVSLASENIASEKNVSLSIRSDVLGDYKATNNGVIVFPIFETIVYSLAGLLSNLFSLFN